MRCRFVPDGQYVRCRRCGTRLFAVEGQPLDRYRATCRNALPLGDWLAAILMRVGITPARVAKLAVWRRDKECGCEARQRRLNQLGDWLYRLLRS